MITKASFLDSICGQGKLLRVLTGCSWQDTVGMITHHGSVNSLHDNGFSFKMFLEDSRSLTVLVVPGLQVLVKSPLPSHYFSNITSSMDHRQSQ